jgi:hypothetical protein
MLRPDPSLTIESPIDVSALITNESDIAPVETGLDNSAGTAPVGDTKSYIVQFETPDVASVAAIESTVRGTPGVKSSDTTSLALGGTSVMRVSFLGDMAALKSALAGRGFRVEEGSGALRIRRSAASDSSPTP